ncbi:coproporphyrinogen-III oxidase family protein [Agarilytica rhodophyticola]|uniref:coproporphyrinogen-III oxidase family protein n=1 Tax=Agarilytica rhodophyticola TaxID=1737490 RepID=UPI000B3420EB|nr:coproporphyrinogen-III oxidase family protein [Agarilytica rhodophyticola]
MANTQSAIIARSGKKQKDSVIHYSDEKPNRDGFVVAWPPQRYWQTQKAPSSVNTAPLHLYFHIPFCLQRCRYCFFKIGILSENSHEVRERYVSALCKEIEQVAEDHNLQGRKISSIYFGGGTPSVLSPKQLEKVKDTIDKFFTVESPEFVFEIEPVTLNNRLIDSLPDLGVNRISFGIQSFDDRVVALTGRHDTEEKNCRAIERALKAGIVVNVDLLSGLEGETFSSWQHSVNRAIDLGVNAITVYKLELYSNANYMEDAKKGNLSLPTNEQELEFARWALNKLNENNYLPSTYFTFTREGNYPQHHIISRWRGEDMYGFGASAFGSINGYSRQNISDIDEYLNTVEQGKNPNQRIVKMNTSDYMLRDLVMGLKTTVVDLDKYQQNHGIDLKIILQKDIQTLLNSELIEIKDNFLKLTREGILYGDYCGRYLGAALRNIFSGESRPIRA